MFPPASRRSAITSTTRPGSKSLATVPHPKALEHTVSIPMSARLKASVEDAARKDGSGQAEIVRRAVMKYLDDTNSAREAWATIDRDEHYNPSDFFTEGRDKQGHYSEIRVQIPTDLAGEMARLIEDRRLDHYKTRQHVTRDAIYHRLKYISKLLDDEKLEHAVDMAMLESDEIMEAARQENATRLIDSMTVNLRALWSRAEASGRYEKIAAYLADRAGKAQVIDEEWREEYETVLREYRKKVRPAVRAQERNARGERRR